MVGAFSRLNSRESGDVVQVVIARTNWLDFDFAVLSDVTEETIGIETKFGVALLVFLTLSFKSEFEQNGSSVKIVGVGAGPSFVAFAKETLSVVSLGFCFFGGVLRTATGLPTSFQLSSWL